MLSIIFLHPQFSSVGSFQVNSSVGRHRVEWYIGNMVQDGLLGSADIL